MIIPQSGGSSAVGTVQNIPQTLLLDKVIGQRIEARVIQATLAAATVAIKIGDSVLQLRTSADLQAGQKIQLEWVEQGG